MKGVPFVDFEQEWGVHSTSRNHGLFFLPWVHAHLNEALNRAIELHGIEPVVDRVVPFEQAPEAFEAMSRSEHFGKIAIRVA